MKKLLLLIICPILLSCSKEETLKYPVEIPDYVMINGIQKSLITTGDEPGLAVYYNSGGYTLDTETGNYTSVYYRLNIHDPNNVFLNGFNNDNLQNDLKLQFVTGTNSFSGFHNTIPETSSVMANNETFSSFLINEESSFEAASGQPVLINKTATKTVIQFSNIHYGNYTLSGKFTLDF